MKTFNLPFTKYRPYAFAFSALLILVGVISLAVNYFTVGSFLNLGIDFTGGTILHLRLAGGFDMEEVREVLAPFELEGVPLQRVGRDGKDTGDEVVIKTPQLGESSRQELLDAFRKRWPQMADRDILRVDNVGAVIGKELTREAFLALLAAAALMILYITLRFEFKFALAAIAALIHDVLLIVGIFSLFRLEVSSTFIAAVLTIIGYSVNDTIVIFDRIRENVKYRAGRTLEQVVEESINSCLVRCINTFLTTLLVLLSLFVAFNYFVGGMDLKLFALALLIGVVGGTYSSIFIAGPLWLLWQGGGHRKKAPAHS